MTESRQPYIYIYINMYIYIYIYIYHIFHMNIFMTESRHTSIYEYIYIYTQAYIQVCICIYICVCVCVYLFMFVPCRSATPMASHNGFARVKCLCVEESILDNTWHPTCNTLKHTATCYNTLQHTPREATRYIIVGRNRLFFCCNGKTTQSLVSRNSNIERRMNSPKSVVGVIRGVA